MESVPDNSLDPDYYYFGLDHSGQLMYLSVQDSFLSTYTLLKQ